MKYPPIGLEVLGRCIFRNSYEDPYEKWLVVFYQEGKWRDTIEGEEQEVLFWREIDESPFVFDGLVEIKNTLPVKKPLRRIWTDEKLEDFKNLVVLGKSNQEIADHFKTTKKSVEAIRFQLKRSKEKTVIDKKDK